uniref:Nucleoporin SEH1 (Trinotate prediction) n=1 Tax=Myxobolus squamalis TaxID=59785 RepID=A0A6B2G1G2_MYXSQ
MKCVSLGHDERVNTINFDSRGKRLVSCSDDSCIKVWDLDSNGEIKLSHSWKAHQGKVIKSIFSDFIFGNVIASCSAHSISIWEESKIFEEDKKIWAFFIFIILFRFLDQ